MKVTQTVETKYNQFYVGYGYCEHKDAEGNLVSVKLSDDNILEMYETLAYKRERILKQRAEEAAEQQRALEAQENENE